EDQLNDLRQKTFDRERHLDKQQDLLEARADQLQKQEKMVENNQRKLAEKLEDANRRQSELDNLLDAQRQALHQISGLSPEEAKRNRALRRTSCARNSDSWPQRASHQPAPPVALPHQLQSKRPATLDRSRIRRQHDGRGIEDGPGSRPAGRPASRYRQGGRPR